MQLGSASCHHYEEKIETTLHVLRYCLFALVIWINLVHQDRRRDFFNADLTDWIAMNVSRYCGKEEDLEWSFLWANTYHFLWTWRNKKSHDEEFVMPSWVEVIKETRSYLNAASHQLTRATMNKVTLMIRWIPQDVGWTKLNTDGASNKECEIAVCGGLIRGADGMWQIGFSKSLGYCNAYIAELWGIYEGLRVARYNGLHLSRC